MTDIRPIWWTEASGAGTWRVTNGTAAFLTTDPVAAASLAAHLHATGHPDGGPVLGRAALERQWAWSQKTFGAQTTRGVIDHLKREINEVDAAPDDLEEWVDVIRLGLDGACRSGSSPQEILEAIAAKQRTNEQREWPDRDTTDPDKAIEHLTGEEDDS